MTRQQPPDDLKALFSLAIAQSPAPVVMTDLKGNIFFCNQAFTLNTGYSLDEVIGKNPRILKSGFMNDSIYRELWTTITSGKVWQGELCNKGKDEKIYWENIAISPIKDEKGEVQCFMAVWLNITARKFDEGLMKTRLKSLEHETTTDPLTEKANRRAILEELGREVDRAVRYKRQLSGLMYDIDQFKKINDVYGHLAGDYVLRETASVVEKSIRKVDKIGRFGGDEFIVLFPESTIDHIKIVAERIRKNVSEHPFMIQGQAFQVTISMGLASFDPASGDDKNAFLSRMDQALLSAKRLGKNLIASA